MAMRRPSADAHGAHHVQAGRIAFGDEARAPRLPLRRVGQQLRAYQARQRQVVEEVVHELFARDPEDEVVLALPVVRGAAAADPPPPPCGRWMRSPRTYSWLPGCTSLAAAAGPWLKTGSDTSRLGSVMSVPSSMSRMLRSPTALRTASLDLLAVAAQEPLAVADRLVLARQAPVDDLVEHGPLRLGIGGRHWAPSPSCQELLRTRRYHSHSRRTCRWV